MSQELQIKLLNCEIFDVRLVQSNWFCFLSIHENQIVLRKRNLLSVK